MPIKLSDITDPLYRGVDKAKEFVADKTGYNRFMATAQRAGDAASEAFSGQSWDNSQRNAARHSMWMAMQANDMGGGPIARGAAKGIGYLHEGLGLVSGDNLTAAGARDMRHDLNNNAVGLNTLADINAQGPVSEQQIIDTLIEKARQSKRVSAPSVLGQNVGVLTRGQ